MIILIQSKARFQVMGSLLANRRSVSWSYERCEQHQHVICDAVMHLPQLWSEYWADNLNAVRECCDSSGGESCVSQGEHCSQLSV